MPVLTFRGPYNVFNVDQYEGFNLAPMGDTQTLEPIAAAQSMVDGMPNSPSIAHDGGNRPSITSSLLMLFLIYWDFRNPAPGTPTSISTPC